MATSTRTQPQNTGEEFLFDMPLTSRNIIINLTLVSYQFMPLSFGYMLDSQGLISDRGKEIFFYSTVPRWL
jgi:hypothetical protein